MEKSISRNIIFKFILNIFNLVVPVLIGPYVLRIIGPEMNGTINYAQTIYSYFFILYFFFYIIISFIMYYIFFFN